MTAADAPTLAELGALTRRLSTEYAVSRILAEAGPAEPTLERALAVMGQKLQWDYCVCWRLEPAAPARMRIKATWQRHRQRSGALERAGRGLVLTPGVGAAGRAWEQARPVWIDDVANDPHFLLHEQAREAGLGTGVCCPMQFGQQVLGVVEFIAARDAVTDPETLPVLVSLAEQIGQFLHREAIAAALQASEARLRALFEANIAGVHCGRLSGETVAVNPAFVRMFRFPSTEQALACPASALYTDPNERLALLEQLREHGSDANRQLQLRRHDGEPITVLVNTVMIPGSGGEEAYTESTIVDITELRALELRRWQSSKMEGIGRLAGGIAHDFNNMLTVINGYGDQLLAHLEADDPTRASVAKMRQAGHRAEGLTRQLLAFSRQQAVEPVVVDVVAAVEEIENMLGTALGSSIRLRRAVAPALGRIRADPSQLSQILMNLALNARDAMPHGGELLIEAENITVDAAYAASHAQARPGPFVRLSVSDTGVGMDERARRHAFEPFFTTKPQGQGTGLGLATVYGLVLQNGGWTELYSEPGRGTTFKLHFPRVEAPALAEPAKAAAPVAGRARMARVLVAEDEPDLGALITEILREAGYAVCACCDDGARALQYGAARAGELDLLITDVIMPKMTGPDLADRLRVCHPGLRVLFISGYTEQAAARQSLLPDAREGWAYLQKPFGPQALLEAVLRLLEPATRGERAVSTAHWAGAKGLESPKVQTPPLPFPANEAARPRDARAGLGSRRPRARATAQNGCGDGIAAPAPPPALLRLTAPPAVQPSRAGANHQRKPGAGAAKPRPHPRPPM
ncbi:MAG: ATP-binding protein [Terriglobales bacterium]